jgi:adenine-specific DNA-methyltransferase
MKNIETYNHEGDKRRNIPTAEYESVMAQDDKAAPQLRYPRNTDLDPQLVWRGKDEQDWSDLVTYAPPLYIQEKVHPKVLLNDLLAQTKRGQHQQGQLTPDLFADFNGIPRGVDKTEFYAHEQNWSNRMILGDSLQVMASLAEREGLRGKVQCIYLDPPYGIKFNSNFQWSTTSRDVKDGNAEHITREPEQVKAFRDTWRDGIHSYLTYLRDRLTVARDLLTESGSIFVQIGDENVHRVRAVMDEVFGDENFVSQIGYATSTGRTSKYLADATDYVLWFVKNSDATKYRQLYNQKEFDSPDDYELSDLTSQGAAGEPQPFLFQGSVFKPSPARHWSNEHLIGMPRLAKADRIFRVSATQIRAKKILSERSLSPINSRWLDTQMGAFGGEKIYVVQTTARVIQRCILMSTDPGDLVLDPTCGSGTTAYVAEQWGRRWITIDTSRVALALARARIMGARYPYYLLADSPEGRKKQWQVSSGKLSEEYSPLVTSHYSLRQGFVYERVPHITLKSIANNAEIDVIWEEYEAKLAPLREQLSVVSGQWSVNSKQTTDHQSLTTNHCLQEWEIPRERPDHWPPATDHLLKSFWDLRIARQREIDASIAANADFENLYDKPYEDKKKVRVAGPFTVESLSPHRMLGVDENGEMLDPAQKLPRDTVETQSFEQMILDNLKTSGVQQSEKGGKINFTTVTPWPGHYICAEGIQTPPVGAHGNVPNGGDGATNRGTLPCAPTVGGAQRAAIFIGPEFGTVRRDDLVAAAREAGDAGFDMLIACAFNYEAHATEFNKLGRIPVLKARMNADLHMSDDLKNTGKGNLFVVFGEPDVVVDSGQWLVTSNGRMVANYECIKELSGLDSLAEINRMGGEDLPGFKAISSRREVRPHQPASARSGLGAVEHSGRGSQERSGGVSAVSGDSGGITGGSGDSTDRGTSAGNVAGSGTKSTFDAGGGTGQNAVWPQAVAAIETLKPADFPLQLTTAHWSQVTVRGVDVFKPQSGKVESSDVDGIACWFVDTDYNEESFFVRQAYFLGANDPYKSLKTTLKAEIDRDAWETLHSNVSRPFEKPASGKIAVKVINHLGDEVMKVFRV